MLGSNARGSSAVVWVRDDGDRGGEGCRDLGLEWNGWGELGTWVGVGMWGAARVFCERYIAAQLGSAGRDRGRGWDRWQNR